MVAVEATLLILMVVLRVYFNEKEVDDFVDAVDVGIFQVEF